MSLVVRALLVGIWLTAAQTAPTANQETWLKSFEGTWVVDGAVGDDAKIVLNIAREGMVLVLRVVVRDREIVTRYDFSGADVMNQHMGGKSTFRTRIEGQSLVTQIWDSDVAVGPPARIETRFLQSPDIMMTELANAPGEQAYNRTPLRRRGSQ